MVIKTVDIQVFADNDYVTRIELSQYEYLEKSIAFNIYHNKDKIDLSTVKEATFYGTKSDGHFLRNVCRITEDGQVIYSITEQTTVCAGLVRGLVQLTTDEGILRCYGVNFIVLSAPEILPIESTDEVTGLNVFIEKIRELLRPNLVPEEGTEGYFLVKTENGSEWRSINLTPEQLADIAESVKSELDLSEYAKKTEIQPAVDEYISIHKDDLKGDPGNPGEKGDRGDDGSSVTADVRKTESGYEITLVDKNGPHMFEIQNGKDGLNGIDGKNGINGTDGFSPILKVQEETDEAYILSLTDATHTIITPNLKGAKGDTYVLTQADKEDIASLVDLDSKIDKPTQDGTAGQVLTLDENGLVKWDDQQGGGSTKAWKKVAQVVLEEAVRVATISLDDYNSYDECVIYITQAGGSTTATQIYAFAWANSINISASQGFLVGSTGTATSNQQSCMRFSRLSDNKVLLDFCGNTRGGNISASYGNSAYVSCRLIDNYGNKFGFSVGNGLVLPVGFAFDVYVR